MILNSAGLQSTETRDTVIRIIEFPGMPRRMFASEIYYQVNVLDYSRDTFKTQAELLRSRGIFYRGTSTWSSKNPALLCKSTGRDKIALVDVKHRQMFVMLSRKQ